MTETEVTEGEERTEARRRVEAELLNGVLDLDRETERLRTIGEPTRFTVLYLLTSEGRLHSGELADLLDRRQNDLYHHLNELEDAGLVGKRRADDGGRIYELSPLAENVVQPVFDAIRTRAEAV